MPAPWQQVALPVTLTDMLNGRNKAIELHQQARRIGGLVNETLKPFGDYMMPNGMQFGECEERAIWELDTKLWRRAFDLTGFKQLMDAEAVAEFERSLSPHPPEFTEANIRSTFVDLQLKAGHMFRRGIVNVFRRLADKYKTNAAEPFKVGRKVVMSYMVDSGFQKGLRIRISYGSEHLNDIDRVVKTLDGKEFKPRSLESDMNAAFTNTDPFEDDYYRARAFKNGNLHLEFKRLDLLEKLNEQIAEFYSEGALAGRRT